MIRKAPEITRTQRREGRSVDPTDPVEPHIPGEQPAVVSPSLADAESMSYQPPTAAAPASAGVAPVMRTHTPGVLIASGVILLVLAVLALLWTVLFFVYGALITSITSAVQSDRAQFGSVQFGPMAEAMRPVLYALAFVIFCLALAHLGAGIGVLGRRGWARITGLVLAVLGLGANLLGLISILASAGSARQQVLSSGVEVDPVPGIVFAAVIFISFGAAYFFVLITLARRGRDFM